MAEDGVVVIHKMSLDDEARTHVDEDVQDEEHVNEQVEPEPDLHAGRRARTR